MSGRIALRVAAVAVACGSMAGGVTAWLVTDAVEGLAVIAPQLSAAGEPTGDLVTITQETIDEVRAALTLVSATTDAVGTSATETAEIVQGVAELTTGPVPQSLIALRESLPALIDTAAVIDNAMRALAVLGVPYEPGVPFDVSLQALQDELEGLPEEITEQGRALERVVPRIEAAAADTTLLADHLLVINESLGEARARIDGYRQSIEALGGLSSIAGPLTRATPFARAAIVVAAASGLVVAATAWGLAGTWPEVVAPRP